jgi:hypothetical protein
MKSKEEGIPFYLPKPLLIVAKNFRNVEDAKVGLTDTAPIPNVFDDQGKYADLNARASFNFADPTAGDTPAANNSNSSKSTKSGTEVGDPNTPPPDAGNNNLPASTATKSGAYTYSQNAPNVSPHDVPSDGLAPNTFFTYHIVFVPDLTQKYGLKVSGGVGEIRAAMNLVNGWQFTGLGPYYMKDSSTAQDLMASGIAARLGGQAVQDVLKGVAGLTGRGTTQAGTVNASAPQVQELARAIGELPRDRFPLMSLPNYAEIHVFEPRLGADGQMEWSEIANLSFNRDFIGSNKTKATFYQPAASNPGTDKATPPTGAGAQLGFPGATAPGGGQVQTGLMDTDLTKRAVASALGIPADSQALQAGIAATPTPATTPAHPSWLGGLFHHEPVRQAAHRTRIITDLAPLATTTPSGPAAPPQQGIAGPQAPATGPAAPAPAAGTPSQPAPPTSVSNRPLVTSPPAPAIPAPPAPALLTPAGR